MRKLILFMHLSLDGFVCGPNGELDWATMKDDDMGKYLIGDLLATVDTLLAGRNLFQGFQSYWPAQINVKENPKELIEFAKWMDDAPKFVYSNTLKETDWKNSTIISGDLKTAVDNIKQMPGGDIVVFGGAQMSSSLANHGLIDEYRFKLEPVVIGEGKPLFTDFKEKMKLKLIKAKTFKEGVQGLYYRPVK